MARVTVEDCAEVIPSRFELVAIAAQRAKAISSGAEISVSRDNDKDAVVALREIAENKIDVKALREMLVQSSQEKVKLDQYGVEETSENGDEISEVAEDIKQLQSSSPAEGEGGLYGDNVDYED